MKECPDELFPLIFDSINEGVFTVDEDFRITSFNAAAERIIGISKSDAIGEPCHEVLRASICQKGCALRSTLETGEPKRDIRVDVLNAHMESVPITISTAVLRDSDGRLIGGVEIFKDVSEMETLRSELDGRRSFRDIIGQSAPMREIFALIPQVAESEAPVLVRGPSGTGKELVAQAVHDLSPRKDSAFIRVNSGALPDTLLESELFGYVRGAFTGANRDKPGRFQLAHGGTLFLDEIGDISPASQAKLLRALEEGEIQPLGAEKTTKVDVRLICATNQDLESMVADGRFREDLYYRIRVIPIDLPPLNQRREDIPLLIAHFVKLHSARTGRPAPGISRKAMRLLYDYKYPGNVRELRNIIERAFVLCSRSTIEPHCLPPEVVFPSDSRVPRAPVAGPLPSEKKIALTDTTSSANRPDTPEVRKLLSVLEAHGWNRTATARELGIGRTTLWRRMKGYELI
jgi:PAS domain S-box-containing protein